MPRIEHWERRLAEAIDTARAKPFVWGAHNCSSAGHGWLFEEFLSV